MDDLDFDVNPVSKYRTMDVKTEDLLFSGMELRNGMIVLIENQYRMELVDSPSDDLLWRIQLANRWCQVSNVICTDVVVGFVATYADGTKVKREYPLSISWYVKKASIPTESKPTFRNDVIVGEYTERHNEDGTTSIYITEQNGNVTEFIVGAFTNLRIAAPGPVQKVESQKTFDELLKEADGNVSRVIANNLQEVKRHDPAWLTENLPPKKDFSWLTDPTPTRTDIPVFKENSIDQLTRAQQEQYPLDDPEATSADFQIVDVTGPMFIAPDPTEGAQDSAGEVASETVEDATIPIQTATEVRSDVEGNGSKIVPDLSADDREIPEKPDHQQRFGFIS
jgi:hypothetical protein